MVNLAPSKSKFRYEKAWADVLVFLEKEEGYHPTEEDLILYFMYLEKDQGFKSSSLWSLYSRTNNGMKHLYIKNI